VALNYIIVVVEMLLVVPDALMEVVLVDIEDIKSRGRGSIVLSWFTYRYCTQNRLFSRYLSSKEQRKVSLSIKQITNIANVPNIILFDLL